MKQTAILLLFFFVPELWAQENVRQQLRGKITADTSQFQEVFVINHSTNEAAEVQTRGYFTIMAAAGDTLLFSSMRFKARQYIVKKSDFDGDLLIVELQSMIALDEVVVERYERINAVDLRILPKEAKKYTPAERRLKTAGDLKAQDFIGILGGGMPADPIINAITGRSAQMKKEVQIEKKETFMKQIEDLFDETYITGNLKIPATYVKGFLYFIVENDSFTRLLPERNKTALSFLLTQLAEKYMETVPIEKK
jgi:hypothetical protein